MGHFGPKKPMLGTPLAHLGRPNRLFWAHVGPQPISSILPSCSPVLICNHFLLALDPFGPHSHACCETRVRFCKGDHPSKTCKTMKTSFWTILLYFAVVGWGHVRTDQKSISQDWLSEIQTQKKIEQLPFPSRKYQGP